jgi:hypothetical protein
MNIQQQLKSSTNLVNKEQARLLGTAEHLEEQNHPPNIQTQKLMKVDKER